ncbi:MAG: nicotinate (nicotinamide) nucleotide adenylyltransferase [Opitutae bacterium]|nr:nicotinate (nicotinamide) nucleotide adenylyltransferase [Opitutae bacterium]
MRIGFLGGSFDPVHLGHLCVAQDACERCQLDRVVLVPAAQAPLKPHDVRASAADRLAMLQLAIEDNPRLAVSDFELRKGGVSYTIDSVRHFRQQHPADELFWIIGGDQLPKLPLWREAEELARAIAFIVLERPGHPAGPDPALPGLRLLRCAGHQMEISSSELRERARQGLPLDCFMPHKAIVYLRKNVLYGR